MFDAHLIKKDFPILSRVLHGDKQLIYLDSAATSQKPQVVLDTLMEYYTQHNANVHRGIHVLGDESTRMFHEARTKVAEFFGAHEDELILVRNTTEALNTIAYAWGDDVLRPGDVILTTEMEHHSNLVPWQQLAKRKKCVLAHIRVTDEGLLDMQDFKKKIQDERVKLVTIVHVSNAVGTRNPVEEITRIAHAHNAAVVIDGAQSAPHLPIDFHKIGCDFFAFSGHKMLAPMGIGGLLVRRELLKSMSPVLFGGGMINEVSLQETSFADLPDKFIAGTPDVAGAVGLAAACSYLDSLGMKMVDEYDRNLIAYTIEQLQTIPQVHVIGPLDPSKRCGSVAFTYDGVHAHDVAQVLDSEGVAVRSGHHCTMPLHKKFGWAATTRASFSVYTTKEDINALVKALKKVETVFGGDVK